MGRLQADINEMVRNFEDSYPLPRRHHAEKEGKDSGYFCGSI